MMTSRPTTFSIQGEVAPGFEQVETAFYDNFAQRQESGAACCVYHRGHKVVDLWGGYRDAKQKLLWQENTCVPVFSASKGVASVALAVAHSRDWLDFDETVATYWPDFAQQGKENITVRQLLSHQAGLCVIDSPLFFDDLKDMDRVCHALAQQKPVWTPGTHHGYHSVSLGWYESALLRHIDPQGRYLSAFFQDEIAKPWDLSFYFGLPADFPQERLATIETVALWKMPFHLGKLSWPFVRAFLNPWSLSSRSIRNPKVFNNPANINRRDLLALEVPAVTGVGEVRSIAKAYGIMANGGDGVVLHRESVEEFAKPVPSPTSGHFDQILQTETVYGLGTMRSFPDYPFSQNPRAFGTPGAGGSLGFADPDLQLGYAYAPTRMDFYIFNDPRERALREAVMRCLA